METLKAIKVLLQNHDRRRELEREEILLNSYIPHYNEAVLNFYKAECGSKDEALYSNTMQECEYVMKHILGLGFEDIIDYRRKAFSEAKREVFE